MAVACWSYRSRVTRRDWYCPAVSATTGDASRGSDARACGEESRVDEERRAPMRMVIGAGYGTRAGEGGRGRRDANASNAPYR